MKYSLPESSNDLLIKDGKLLMRTLSIYEVLRRFSHIIRLTPFRFEDFSAALLAEDQSILLADIHIQLLRTLVREDRQQQTWLGPPDIRDSINLYLHLIDHSNWPSALRIYFSADAYNNSFVLDLLDVDDTKCYPFSSDLETRLCVLEQLCDQFLMSVMAREEIVNGGIANEKRETSCRQCSKSNGSLIACNRCPASYHLKCSDPPLDSYPDVENGDEEYLCALCRSNHIQGVTDCISEDERGGNLKRHEALGMDQLGRRYWFIVRRLFVVDETEDDVRYYTTVKQLNEIIEGLNESEHEEDLIENLGAAREEIERQMKITEDLYATLLKDQKREDGTYSLMLGQDGTHRCYANNYSSNHTATGKIQPQDRDMYRSLNNKFCMTNSFKWFGAINGHLNTITLTIRTTILKFELAIPNTFVHPSWKTKRCKWMKAVNNAQNPTEYAKALTQLELGIKPVLFKAAWYDSVGFIDLLRSTFLEREELKKIDRQPRGFERDERVTADFELSNRLGTMVKFSPKLKPVKHQVWKQKGEEYRLTGLNGWYWRSITHKPRPLESAKFYRLEPSDMSCCMNDHPFVVDMIVEKIRSEDVIDVAANLSLPDDKRILYPKIPVTESRRLDRVRMLEGLLDIKLKEIEKKKKALDAATEIPKRKEDGSKIDLNGELENKPAHNVHNNGPSLTPKIVLIKNGNGDTTMTPITNTHIVRTYGTPKVVDSNNKSFNLVGLDKRQPVVLSKIAKPRLPPSHDFTTRRGKVRSLLVLPGLELARLARSGGLKEARTFSYTAKPNQYIWPYGVTPRPTFRTCWLYRNQLVDSIQDISLQLKVFYACIRWDDLQARPPASGHTTIVTDESTVTIELLKKRDRLPYLLHSEYLIRKTTTPNEQPTKYRKIGTKTSTPSARSGLRARRQVEEEEEKKPTREEVWVSEYQLELWELKQFDEKIERQNALMRERALREEAERRRKLEEEKRRAAEQEKRKLRAEQEEFNKKARLSSGSQNSTPQTPYRPNINNSINTPNSATQTPPSTPVLRYFRTEQGQIIRLPASYLQRGTPLILRHVTPGTNQTNTYIIRPQAVATTTTTTTMSPIANNVGLRPVMPGTILTQSNNITPTVRPIFSEPLQTLTLPPVPTLNIAAHTIPSSTTIAASTSTATTNISTGSLAAAAAAAATTTTTTTQIKVEPNADSDKVLGCSYGAPTSATTTATAMVSDLGDKEDTKPLLATSVGTVGNEMAHDQHAPSSEALVAQASLLPRAETTAERALAARLTLTALVNQIDAQ